MTDIIIRNAEQKDFKQVIKLQKQAELFTAEGKSYEIEWCFEYISDLFLVAEIDNIVIGYILGEKLKLNGSAIWFIAVDKNFRNAGIGKKLLKQFEENCKNNNIKWIIAYSETNPSTLAFYKNNNFTLGKEYKEILKTL